MSKSISSTPVSRLRLVLLLFAAAFAFASCPALAGPSAASAAPIQITDGVLKWGVKGSWRGYAGPGVQSGGVTQNAQGVYEFPIESGSYDPETKTTTVNAKGTIHWQGHYYPGESHLIDPPAGYSGPLDIWILDITIKDPTLTISAAGSSISVEAISRNIQTWELADLGRTEFAELDPSGLAPTGDAGVTSWSGIPAALSETGAKEVFGNNYTVGMALDQAAFSYTGEGGVPDFAESWTEPDSNGLELAKNGILGEMVSLGALWVDADDHIVQTTTPVAESFDSVVQAFDLDTGEPVGSSVRLTSDRAFQISTGLIDPAHNTAYFSSTLSSTLDSYFRWNEVTGDYEEGAITPIVTAAPQAKLYDPVGERWIKIAKVVPEGAEASDFEAHEWYVFAYELTAPGVFSEIKYRLPNGPTGYNRSWYTSPSNGAVAADGSIVLPRGTIPAPQAGVTPAVLEQIGAQRIVLDDATGTASVTEIPATMVPPAEAVARRFQAALANATGDVAFYFGGTSVTPSRVLQLHLDNGALVPSAPEAQITQTKNAVFSLGADGTVWHLDNKAQRLSGLRDGLLVYTKVFNIVNMREAALLALPDGSVAFKSSDGTAPNFGSAVFGWARFLPTGYSPVIATQPVDKSLTIEPTGSGQATFTVAATGTPAPTLQWQRRAAGSSKFTDIAGETGTTLTVDAAAADNGAAYRAIAGNPAGALATEPADLEVRYRPTISFDLADRGGVEGEDVVFSLLSTASPEAQTTWQRRVGGFWQDVDTGSGDFEAGATKLTVKGVTPEMSGALFRAKLTNAVGTTYSRTAELTVTGVVTAPVTFGSGTFDWGFANRWRCYVTGTVAHGGIDLSGGVTRVPGTTAGGGLCPGAGAESEALRFPVRGGSYDPADGGLEVKLNGSVRFWGHVSGGKAALDTTFSDLRLVASGETGTLYADATGATMANPTVITRDDVPLVTVDLTGPAPAGSTGLDWAGATSELTAQGAEVFGAYPAGEPFDPISMSLAFGIPQPDPEPEKGPDPKPETRPDPEPGDKATLPPSSSAPQSAVPAEVKPGKRVQELGENRIAELGSLACPQGAPCTVTAPRRVQVRIGEHRFRLPVLVRRSLAAGATAPVRVRLPKGAAAQLEGRQVAVTMEITVLSGGIETRQKLRVIVRG